MSEAQRRVYSSLHRRFKVICCAQVQAASKARVPFGTAWSLRTPGLNRALLRCQRRAKRNPSGLRDWNSYRSSLRRAQALQGLARAMAHGD